MRRTSFLASLAGLAVVGLSGCETYEFPPRLRGVGTDNCPACEVFLVEESRLPLGGVATLSARFAFEDEWGSLSGVRVFVTTPSGDVLEEVYVVLVEKEVTIPGDTGGPSMTVTVIEEEERTRPGFTCAFRAESLATPVATCDLVSERESSIGSVAVLLDGIEQGQLSVKFGVDLSEVGEWTVEVEAERSGGARSNRLSTTFDVVEDLDNDDGG